MQTATDFSTMTGLCSTRIRAFGAILLIGLASTTIGAVSAPAQADEQIILPYSCQVKQGRVIARPAPEDQAYRIIGGRERQPFRACEGQDTGRCKFYMLQRFTLACDGGRASWPQVYAAISEVTDGRAVLDGGQLRIEPGARSPSRPGAPPWGVPTRNRDRYSYERQPDFSDADDFGGPPFAGEPDEMRDEMVELPAGFAPLAGTNAIFTELDPRVAAAVEEGRVGDAPANVPFDVKPAGKGLEPPQSAAATSIQAPELPDLPERKPSVAAAAPAPAVSTPVMPATPDKLVENAVVPTSPPAASPPLAVPSTSVAPTILNNPAANKVAAATPPPAAKPPAAPPVDPTSPPKVVATDLSSSATDTKVATGSDSKPMPVTIETGVTPSQQWPSLPMPLIAAAIAAATLLLAIILVKRQHAEPAYAGQPGSPTEPRLSGWPRTASHSSRRGTELVKVPQPEPQARDLEPDAGSAGGATPREDVNFATPQTREEALDILGLSDDASPDAIRKVTDALRQSWHPDKAQDETDRKRREARSKAVNAAYDLLVQKV